jgi:hypothetical protein
MFKRKTKDELLGEYKAEKALYKKELKKEKEKNELLQLKEKTQKMKQARFKKSTAGKVLNALVNGGKVKGGKKPYKVSKKMAKSSGGLNFGFDNPLSSGNDDFFYPKKKGKQKDFFSGWY